MSPEKFRDARETGPRHGQGGLARDPRILRTILNVFRHLLFTLCYRLHCHISDCFADKKCLNLLKKKREYNNACSM